MNITKIPKKSGGFRTIYSPNENEKQILRDKLPLLHDIQDNFCDKNIVQGFRKGHNIVTNALMHVGKNYTTCFDLKDFFDSVTEEKLINNGTNLIWHEYNLKGLFIDGAARQGLPTSPIVANLAAIAIDAEIVSQLQAWNIVYTRYADDLAFSYDDIATKDILLTVIPKAVKAMGFEINEKKTRTMSAKKGRRIITGIAVDKTDIHVPRKIKRKLRSALHRKKAKTAIGFLEYCKLKLPRNICSEMFESWKEVVMSQVKSKISARNLKNNTLSLDSCS